MRSSDESTCTNISKMRASWSGAMPMPSSRTRTTATRSLALDAHVDAAAAVGELAGVAEQVVDDLGETRGIGVEVDRLGRQAHLEFVAAVARERSRGLDGVRDHGWQLDALPPQLDRAARDAR